MLGREVGVSVARQGHRLLAGDLQELASGADLFIANLECCISARGERVRQLGKRFYFRAPPVAAERLADIGVDCVTLANNHVLDFGFEALRDTLDHLRAVGIAAVGAGGDEAAARAPVVLKPVSCACELSRSATIRLSMPRAPIVRASRSPIWPEGPFRAG